MWLVVVLAGVLALLVVALTALVLRLQARLGRLEARLTASSPSSDPSVRSPVPPALTKRSLDANYVITRIGEVEPEQEPTPVPVVAPGAFAEIVARETTIQAAALAHGLRRALAPETRNRIRFHIRTEIRRSRKQRRTELRDVRREWAARQREAAAADRAA